MHGLPPVYQELGEPSGDDSLADAALALENQVNSGSDCAAVRHVCSVSVRIVFCHVRSPFRQIRFLPSGSPSLWTFRISSLGLDKTLIACASGSSRVVGA